ncbi:complement C1r subcomponent-like protein [Anableps anableps]
MGIFNHRIDWTFVITWFLHVLVCECVPLPDSNPPMNGEVHSPQCPQPYPPNLQKQWDLSVPEGFQISLTFTHLNIKSSITVLCDEKLLGKFCGNENSADGHHPGNQPILSPGNRLTLIFQSDDYNPDRNQNVGFTAQYQAIDIDECSAPEPEDGSGPLCSQICLNTLGSYLCACQHGDELRSDQRTCMFCGRPTKEINHFQRIIGGNDATEDTIPWQALVLVHSSRGGGMIIADRWILTAANVVMTNGQVATPESINIYLGHTDVHRLLETPSLNASAIFVHPQYNNPNYLNYNNDIALIKLKYPVTFSASIMPLCLPAEDDTYETGMMGLVSGFGITDSGKMRVVTNKLKYAHLPLVQQERCNNSLKGAHGTSTPTLTDNMFCAGTPEGGRDSCQGDSGSAFTLQSENGRFWAAGIVSWGIGCGKKGMYGFYTKVANYVDWINKIMQEN